jgi:hypothetical protein
MISNITILSHMQCKYSFLKTFFAKWPKFVTKKSGHYVAPHEDTLRKEENFQVARKEV